MMDIIMEYKYVRDFVGDDNESKALKQRQQGNSAEVIAYADKTNARLSAYH